MARQSIDDEQIERFSARLSGNLIRPEDPDYDDARAVWNGMIDKRPALIARCSGTADVISAVNFARENGLRVAVRGGGHNVAGTALCDDGLVIDCSEMTGVWVDPDEQRVWVQSGATWADVDHETQTFGLATPGGVVSDTGVAGLTIGGGIGHLRCRYGLTCDNLVSVDLVTAAGEFLTASEDEHAELFWGIRGGGVTVGVVTGFEFDCHAVGPDVATCLVFYPGDRLPEILAAYRAYVADAPPEISTLLFAGELPEEALFTEEWLHEGKFAIMGCYAGPPDEGEEMLRPLREFAEPIADVSGTMAYAEFQQLLDADYPDGTRYYWKSLYLDDLTDSAIERIAYWAEAAPSALSTVDVWHLGGAITDAGVEESAFAGRHAPYLLGVEANWEDPAQDGANVEWVRDCLADMSQFSDGAVYVNFPGFFEDADEMLETTFGDAYDRLVALQDEYDPTGLFDRDRARTSSGSAPTDGGVAND